MTLNLFLAVWTVSVVPHVDLDRYAGQWHEIARLPNRFQNDCVGDVTANYVLRTDGKLDVTNRCRTKAGQMIEAKGLAKHVGGGQPKSVLKVRFAPSFLSFLPQVWGDYQILALAPDYSYAAVGSPDLSYLWILSRSPTMASETYRKLIEDMRSQGFSVERLELTAQVSDEANGLNGDAGARR